MRSIRFTLKPDYLFCTIALFIVELYIGLFVHDNFIRPYAGDFLIVILIYCFLKAILSFSVLQAALISLFIAYVVELLQFFHLVKLLGLEHSRLSRIIIGTSSSWEDILMYTLGIGAVFIIERQRWYTKVGS